MCGSFLCRCLGVYDRGPVATQLSLQLLIDEESACFLHVVKVYTLQQVKFTHRHIQVKRT